MGLELNSQWLPVALAVLSLSLTSCSRTVHAREPMTWDSAPQECNPTYHAKPDEYVRFRFLKNPYCFELESSENFCAELQKAGRKIDHPE